MSNAIRKVIAVSAIAFAASAATLPALAADEYNVSGGLTAAGAPLAVHGVDPVAFVNTGNRSAGTAAYTEVYDGAAYYFNSAQNRDAFKKNPKKYMPQNGGFCTFGVSVGKKFDGNPRYAAVVDNKLYLFLNEEIYNAFQKDRKGTIKKAKANWKKIRSTAATDL
ncbi:YHS domain-containing protein [bacterium SCSIO 12696]|nr:YHS domain-containing protein [bacterium SCSIO 12696]